MPVCSTLTSGLRLRAKDLTPVQLRLQPPREAPKPRAQPPRCPLPPSTQLPMHLPAPAIHVSTLLSTRWPSSVHLRQSTCLHTVTHSLAHLPAHPLLHRPSVLHPRAHASAIHPPAWVYNCPSFHPSIHPSVHLPPHQADVPGEGQKFPGNVAAGGTEAGEADGEGKECMRDSVHERRDPRGSRKALGAGSCRLSSQTGSASWRLCDLGKTLLFSGPRIPDLQVHMPGYRDM